LFISLILTTAFGFVEIHHTEHEHVPGEYIVTYHSNTTQENARNHFLSVSDLGVEFIGIYNGLFHKGFAGKIPDEVLVQLQYDPIVMSIEVNMIVRLQATEQTCDGTTSNALSWGLSRISYLGNIGAGLPTTFLYPSTGGLGTNVYVLDTGILTTHLDFGGRATFGINYSPDTGSNDDENGHGTHCAGTIGGINYGVAKATRLVSVKVLDSTGSGSLAGIINGVNWVTNSAVPYKSVISMSLGAQGIITALEEAINDAVARNIAVVVAAGNSNDNACGYSPAGFANCITVGATELASGRTLDSRSSFSNYGPCVHIFAPGTNIQSAWIGSNTATNTISGTSMACPHVAGLSATLLGVNTAMTPVQLRNALIANSQIGLISNVGNGSPNRLAYNGCK